MKKHSLQEYQAMLYDADCRWCRKIIMCPDCEGSGIGIEAERTLGNYHKLANDVLSAEYLCDTCHGTGEIKQKVSLAHEPIKHYEHDGGWEMDGFNRKQWLYVECPNCKYQWALHKLGISL